MTRLSQPSTAAGNFHRPQTGRLLWAGPGNLRAQQRDLDPGSLEVSGWGVLAAGDPDEMLLLGGQRLEPAGRQRLQPSTVAQEQVPILFVERPVWGKDEIMLAEQRDMIEGQSHERLLTTMTA